MAHDAPSRIRVAIIGGGLAGATLANALVRNPRITIDVFESAPEFSERGAAVGLSGIARTALDHAVPSGADLLRRAGGVSMNSSTLMVGSGLQAGKTISSLTADERRDVVVHRASLLRELLAPLPATLLHSSKKLSSISTQADGTIQVSFDDGTAPEFDAVVGADGIFGAVRAHVLGPDADRLAATPAGFWDCRNLVPIADAKATLGDELFAENRQYGWCGSGGFMMHDVCEDGTLVQCVISGIEDDEADGNVSSSRSRSLSREFLTSKFAGWLDGPVARGMIDLLLLRQPDLQGYSQWHHTTTPHYSRGRVCIMGDAAHATTPWQGTGAGLALEDAVVLSTLLGAVSSPVDIDAAFLAYDAVRRDRCQRVVDSSQATGLIMCGQDPEAGVDAARLADKVRSRWDFIYSLDMETHKQEALSKMKGLAQ